LSPWSQALVWVGGLHAAPWLVGHVIRNKGIIEKLVCVAIFAGNPRLK
tara:strand:- start:95 stop:238 length:144 start_codon:yes stop_codon:yes gene_type:complete